MPVKLTDKDYKLIKQQEKDIAAMERDLEVAKELNVPNIEILCANCEEAKRVCEVVKRHYFPGKP